MTLPVRRSGPEYRIFVLLFQAVEEIIGKRVALLFSTSQAASVRLGLGVVGKLIVILESFLLLERLAQPLGHVVLLFACVRDVRLSTKQISVHLLLLLRLWAGSQLKLLRFFVSDASRLLQVSLRVRIVL